MASKIVDKAKDALGMNKTDLKVAGEKIHSTGFGLMGLTWRQNPPSQEQSFGAMKAALEQGANFWNGGEIYGPPDRNSLHLLNEYFTQYPKDADKVVISIKGGLKKGEMAPDGSAENTRRSIDECLRNVRIGIGMRALPDGRWKCRLVELGVATQLSECLVSFRWHVCIM